MRCHKVVACPHMIKLQETELKNEMQQREVRIWKILTRYISKLVVVGGLCFLGGCLVF